MPRRLLIAWTLLMLLLLVELGMVLLPLPPWGRTAILLPAVAMAGIVAVAFMEVPRSPIVARGLAVAGLFWLAVLLGLGSIDPLTRILYPVGVERSGP